MQKPMLPDTYAPHKIIYPCLVQPYVKGMRVFYQAGWFQTENGASLEGNYNHLTKPLTEMFAPVTILDGVLTGGLFLVFDVVNRIPYKNRFDVITQIIRDANKSANIVPVITRKIFDGQQADDQFKTWINDKFTGMIYRLGNCPYTKATSKNKLNISKQLLQRKCENSTPTPPSLKATESRSPSTPQTNHAGFTTAL
jgi:hypothetical protein